MIEVFEAQWPVLAAAAAVLLLAIWLLVRGRKSRPRERHRAPDALDEGAAPAARNQSLIDAPSAVTVARAGDAGVLGREAEPVATPPPPIAAPATPVEAVKFAAAPKPRAPSKVKAPPKAKTPPASRNQAEPKAAPQPKAESKPTAKAGPKPKAELKPKAEPKPKAETKAAPKPAAKPKAAPAAKAAPKPKPKPAAIAATPPPPPVQLSGNLAQIKGLGPKLQALLPSLGLASVADVAAMSDADIDRIDAQLGVFAGRIRKDNWVEQAKLLAAGDVAGYEAKFGKL